VVLVALDVYSIRSRLRETTLSRDLVPPWRLLPSARSASPTRVFGTPSLFSCLKHDIIPGWLKEATMHFMLSLRSPLDGLSFFAADGEVPELPHHQRSVLAVFAHSPSSAYSSHKHPRLVD